MNLSTLYRSLSVPEREHLAKETGTTAGYLYQLATQWRGKKPSLEMIQALTHADARLTVGDLIAEFIEPAPANQPQPATHSIAHGV